MSRTFLAGPVEVLGLPGSGKSTVERVVAESGCVATVKEWGGPRPWVRLPMAVQLFLSAPWLSTLAFATVATRGGVRSVHLRRVFSIQRRYVLLRSLTGRPSVIDEGPMHALFVTLYGTRPTRVSTTLLRRLVQHLARQGVRYVYLDVPKSTCVAQFRHPGRSSIRFNQTTGQDAVAYFMQDHTYDEVMAALVSVAPDRVVRVSSAEAAVAWLFR